MKKFVVPMILMIALVVTACSSGGDTAEPEVTTLIYANLTKAAWDGVDRNAVDKFNRTHKDVKIEVRNYYDEDGVNGKQKLLTEIGAGNIPDIIDLGCDRDYNCLLPYQMMAQKGYFEDLWPYIENDPDLGRDSVLEAPLKAAEVDGGLYTVFDRFSINTLVGPESLVGDRMSWSLADLREAFYTMPEDSTIMEFTFTRNDMFYCLFNACLDSYVDWEAGECFFDSDAFRSNLEFINSFPEESPLSGLSGDQASAVNEEITERLLSGRQMLSQQSVHRPLNVQYLDAFYGGGKASFIGYPVEDGSVGSYFQTPGEKLCMSSTCKNKEAAWEFMRKLLLPQYKSEKIMIRQAERERRSVSFPINRQDYDILKKADRSTDAHATRGLYHGPRLKLRNPTADEIQRVEHLIDSIDKINLYDSEIYNIVYENATAYFAGDKTMDEVIDLIQRRVTLYVNEVR